MSYEIIKHIKVDEKENKVFLQGACNNVRPRTYSYWECESLSKILLEQGRMALDIVILKEYESGNFQRGNNRYTSALKRLKNMPEYDKFDWRNSNRSYEEDKQFDIDNDFDGLLRKALISKFPKEKYIISKQYCMYGTVYAYRHTKLKLSWTNDRSKAKIFHYKKDAESLKNCFIGGDKFIVEKLKATTNDCAKTVDRENAYEIWQSRDKTWIWYVLKKWQIDDNKQHARWFCDVVTPICPDGEMGDVYVKEIKENAIRIK